MTEAKAGYGVTPQENLEKCKSFALQELNIPMNFPTALGVASPKIPKGSAGWRGAKGPQPGNKSGFSATGHRLLLEPEVTETVTESGIVLASKTVAQDKARCVWATVIEIGHDAWSDKSTDFCGVGDKVLVGEYTGKFHTSPVDGKEYRFINDLDVITPLRSV